MPAPPTTLRATRLRAPAFVALVALAVTGALAGACGSPAEEVVLPGPQSPTAPLPRTEFTARANEVCRATTKAIVTRTEEVGSASLDAGTGGDRAALVEAVEPIARQALDRLRNLTPPPGDEETARRALDVMQAAVDAMATDPTAPLDPVGLRQPELFSYGLTGCFTRG